MGLMMEREMEVGWKYYALVWESNAVGDVAVMSDWRASKI
jgi:hypothetical protein